MAVKENLEFIADHQLISAGVDRKAYQYLLLKLSGPPAPQLANPLHFPSPKRRIAMMNKPPTPGAHRLRLLVALPLVAVLLFAFRPAAPSEEVFTQGEISTSQLLPGAGENPNQPPNDTTLVPGHQKDFLKRNPSVKAVGWMSHDMDKMVVDLKSGRAEVYDLNDSRSVAAAREKYGKLPAVPPPPVPAKEALPPSPGPAGGLLPAPPPRRQQPVFIPDNEPFYRNNLPEDYTAFLKRNPSVKQVGWKFDRNKDWNLESVIIYLKSGAQEEYRFEGKRRIPAAEQKYGPLPALPPPVPTRE